MKKAFPRSTAFTQCHAYIPACLWVPPPTALGLPEEELAMAGCPQRGLGQQLLQPSWRELPRCCSQVPAGHGNVCPGQGQRCSWPRGCQLQECSERTQLQPKAAGGKYGSLVLFSDFHFHKFVGVSLLVRCLS